MDGVEYASPGNDRAIARHQRLNIATSMPHDQGRRRWVVWGFVVVGAGVSCSRTLHPCREHAGRGLVAGSGAFRLRLLADARG